MPDIGIPELIIILLIVLLFFGAKKLPELSRGIGEAIRELKRGLKGDAIANENKPVSGKTTKKS